MLSRKIAVVQSTDDTRVADGIQKLITEHGPAINFIDLAGVLSAGDKILINRTANDLQLGTGGQDFVIARIDPLPDESGPAERDQGHLMKLRYTPLQHSAKHVEDIPEFAAIGDEDLADMPAVAIELHSQMGPVIAAGWLHNASPAYVMTDNAALPASYSELVRALEQARSPFLTLSVGQAFPGTARSLTAVNVHNALLFARHMAGAQMAVVGQGPGNTGTGTKYGFSGIEQASNLDIVAALGGTPIACVRASSGDLRERHQGISHHTMTVLELVRSHCIVPLPEGLEPPDAWLDKHDVRIVPGEKTQPALELLREKGIDVTTMGRGIDDDPLFFHTAAAAGIIAAEIALSNEARC